jgi:hypothetical protein
VPLRVKGCADTPVRLDAGPTSSSTQQAGRNGRCKRFGDHHSAPPLRPEAPRLRSRLGGSSDEQCVLILDLVSGTEEGCLAPVFRLLLPAALAQDDLTALQVDYLGKPSCLTSCCTSDTLVLAIPTVVSNLTEQRPLVPLLPFNIRKPLHLPQTDSSSCTAVGQMTSLLPHFASNSKFPIHS